MNENREFFYKESILSFISSLEIVRLFRESSTLALSFSRMLIRKIFHHKLNRLVVIQLFRAFSFYFNHDFIFQFKNKLSQTFFNLYITQFVFIFIKLKKKLEKISWNPSTSNVNDAITIRIVVGMPRASKLPRSQMLSA